MGNRNCQHSSPAICALPNFVAEADMLRWAGIGFSSGKTQKIMDALRHFASKEEGLKKVGYF